MGRINGEFSDLGWTPIWYLFRSLPFDKLINLYSNSDIALINPLRDGMNLVAKEYVASRVDKTGVLVLSEMAGATEELREALIVNPYNFDQITDILKMALEMSPEEQVKRNHILQNKIKNNSVQKWAESFLEELDRQGTTAGFPEKITPVRKKEIIEKYKASKNRLLLLDYDGTLVGFENIPEKAAPDEHLLKILKQIGEGPQTSLFLISGRDKNNLENWFGALPIGLIAEHGAWVKRKGEHWKLSTEVDNKWKEKVFPVLEDLLDKFPESLMEEKNFSLAWHYRRVEKDIPLEKIREQLEEAIQNHNIRVMNGNKVLEMTNKNISKGTVAKYILGLDDYDFILAMGDDTTDEFLFESLPQSAYSIKIGKQETCARYKLNTVEEARELLEKLHTEKRVPRKIFSV